MTVNISLTHNAERGLGEFVIHMTEKMIGEAAGNLLEERMWIDSVTQVESLCNWTAIANGFQR